MHTIESRRKNEKLIAKVGQVVLYHERPESMVLCAVDLEWMYVCRH